MKITKDIIIGNLEKIEKIKEFYPILKDFSLCLEQEIRDSKFDILKRECQNYGLSIYMDFIEFCINTQKRNQQVYYTDKIKVKDFQSVLVENSKDDFAKKSLKNKSVKSFGNLINSKRWDLLTNRSRKRSRWHYSDNLVLSSPIIANFVIQNEIEVEEYHRICNWYISSLPEPDNSIKFEIQKTQDIISFITQQLNDSKSDFLKINYDNLIQRIGNELRSKMLEIEPGEKIKCIELPNNFGELTINSYYNLISKSLENGVLKVVIMNDKGRSQKYNFRYFDSVKEVRNSLLDDLLTNL